MCEAPKECWVVISTSQPTPAARWWGHLDRGRRKDSAPNSPTLHSKRREGSWGGDARSLPSPLRPHAPRAAGWIAPPCSVSLSQLDFGKRCCLASGFGVKLLPIISNWSNSPHSHFYWLRLPKFPLFTWAFTCFPGHIRNIIKLKHLERCARRQLDKCVFVSSDQCP